MITTENIVDILKQLNSQKNHPTKSEEEIPDESISEETKRIRNENQTICRLLKVHFIGFFDNIYVPFKFFRDGDWEIQQILRDNKDSLFYNKKYLTEEDEERFDEVFEKYMVMINAIFSPDNKLIPFLKKWTIMSGKIWRECETNSYLKKILSNQKYRRISPLYITELYRDVSIKFHFTPDKIKPTSPVD